MVSGLSLRLSCAHALVFLIGASLCATSLANWQWHYGFNNHSGWWNAKPAPPAPTTAAPPPCRFNSTHAAESRKITVGGETQKWTFGVNYADWAFKNGPFYLNDTLVFKYDAPSDTNIHPHSVYLLPNVRSYNKCDLSQARLVANETQGTGGGFEFVLKKWQPYYFVCGASAGFHCINGTMKFVAMPIFRPWK